MLREHRDPQTVAGVQLVGQEARARLDHLVQQHETRGGQQRLDVVLADLDRAGIAVIDDRLQHVAVHVDQRDLRLLRVAQIAREHRGEVLAGGGEDEAVGADAFAVRARDEGDVAQFTSL